MDKLAPHYSTHPNLNVDSCVSIAMSGTLSVRFKLVSKPTQAERARSQSRWTNWRATLVNGATAGK
jgi:hypothetical protein